jgi:hypothetical protein
MIRCATISDIPRLVEIRGSVRDGGASIRDLLSRAFLSGQVHGRPVLNRRARRQEVSASIGRGYQHSFDACLRQCLECNNKIIACADLYANKWDPDIGSCRLDFVRLKNSPFVVTRDQQTV